MQRSVAGLGGATVCKRSAYVCMKASWQLRISTHSLASLRSREAVGSETILAKTTSCIGTAGATYKDVQSVMSHTFACRDCGSAMVPIRPKLICVFGPVHGGVHRLKPAEAQTGMATYDGGGQGIDSTPANLACFMPWTKQHMS